MTCNNCQFEIEKLIKENAEKTEKLIKQLEELRDQMNKYVEWVNQNV